MKISRGFIISEGARRRRRGQRETTAATTTWGGREERAGAASMEGAFDNNDIYGDNASG